MPSVSVGVPVAVACAAAQVADRVTRVKVSSAAFLSAIRICRGGDSGGLSG